MADNDQRLLDVLRALPHDAQLEPTWSVLAPHGFVYRVTGSALDDTAADAQLEQLAEGGYVERVFVERTTVCPSCESRALNVHEACISCTSSNLATFKAIFHFRCGYVGPMSSYREEADGLRCPKCHRMLRDLGTDHDSPGDYFECRSCNSMFQVPDVGARCLSCGARFTAATMQNVRHADVYAYRLTERGRAAIQEGRLLGASANGRVGQGIAESHGA